MTDDTPYGLGIKAGHAYYQLKPCPFCATIPELKELRYSNTGRLYGHTICCKECAVFINKIAHGWPMGKEDEVVTKTKLDVLAHWNNRPTI